MQANDMLRGSDDRELDDVLGRPEPKSVTAKRKLLAAGCVFESRQGIAGWWQQGTFLGTRWESALAGLGL